MFNENVVFQQQGMGTAILGLFVHDSLPLKTFAMNLL